MDGDEAWRAGVERERQLGWAARHGARVVGLLSTAVSVACIARDLWHGLSAGTLRDDPESIPSEQPAAWTTGSEASVDLDEDLIDQDPPRPKVCWRAAGAGSTTAICQGHDLRVMCHDGSWWEWSVRVFAGDPYGLGQGEESTGRTGRSESVAKRRAEEALAVMLERMP